MKKALLLILVCSCMITLCACGASEQPAEESSPSVFDSIEVPASETTATSEEIDSMIALANELFTQNSGGMDYLGYEIKDNLVIFKLTREGALERYTNNSKEDLAPWEETMNNLCDVCYNFFGPSGYHTALVFLNDEDQDSALFISVDGKTYYSAAN